MAEIASSLKIAMFLTNYFLTANVPIVGIKIFLQLFLYFAKLSKILQEETIAQEMRNLR